MTRSWRSGWLASAVAYAGVTLLLGRDVLSHLSTGIVHDLGDPLLTAALLDWNAWHLPLSERWWQLPVFHPTPDAMALSEHMLGVSVLAAPIAWIARDALVAANLVTLLTFVLSGLAMYLLVHRLTGSAAGACVAGMAYAFSPYRTSQLAHLQMLATFWAPLALLGLHAYLETGRRRWLVLYAGMWLLQGAANNYLLVFFSVFVGLWIVWFVLVPGRWRALAEIAAATAAAAVPLAPILLRYVAVHARHGFSRGVEEVQAFSADLTGLLCASAEVTTWGWLRIGCRPEGELFPGVAVLVLAAAGLVMAVRGDASSTAAPATASAWARRLRRVAMGAALLNLASAAVFVAQGPWRVDVLGVRISASSLERPLATMLAALAIALALSPRVLRGVRRPSVLVFYLVAALATWVLSLGPNLITSGQVATDAFLPYRWLLALPGVDGIRAPARFWSLTTLSLAVVAGFVTARFVAGRSPRVAAGAAALLSAAVLSDGWVGRIPSVPVTRITPAPADARGGVVMTLPVGALRDILPEFEGVTGGWTTVNGYGGYGPAYYAALEYGVRAELDDVFTRFRAGSDLHVIVPLDASRLVDLVERQPGVRPTGRTSTHAQYRLSASPVPVEPPLGARRRVVRVETTCLPAAAPLTIDEDPATRWYCGPQEGRETLTADLGTTADIGAVTLAPGIYAGEFPRMLAIDTSSDGGTWLPAREGPVIAEAIDAAVREPRVSTTVFRFTSRPARFVRLRQTGRDEAYWSVAELGVWSGR